VKSEKDFVLAALKNNEHSLKFLSKIMKNDKEVVLAAVKNNSNELRFASKIM
jgi:hypothetical protein